MDDATQGLTALLGWSTDFNGSAYNLAGSIAAALLGVALIFVVWALATKKENAKSYLTMLKEHIRGYGFKIIS